MTHPLSAASPTPDDFAAEEELRRNDTDRLRIVRGRAANWVGGLAALTGLLGTVLVVQGPDTITQIILGWRIVVAVLLTAALGLLTTATYLAYRSAFGDAGSLTAIATSPLEGLARRVATARQEATSTVQRGIAWAIRLTLAAIATIAVAVGVTWFAPHGNTDTATNRRCVTIDGDTIAEFDAATLNIVELSPGAALHNCNQNRSD